MKRILSLLMTLTILIAGIGATALADEQTEADPESLTETVQKMKKLEYELYMMTSQSYEGDEMEPDEFSILLYSSEGFGILDLSYMEKPLIMVFDFKTMTADVEGQTATIELSEDSNTIRLTDEDGWTIQYEKCSPDILAELLLEAAVGA